MTIGPALPAESADVVRPRSGFSRRQEQVLDILEERFLSEGLYRLTVADLVARTRCSRRTLYEIAPSKQELFLLVLDRLLRRVGRRGVRAAQQYGDPAQQVEAFLVEGVLQLQQASPEFNQDVEAYPPARALFDRHLAAGVATVQAMITRGVELGQFRELNPALVAEVLVASACRLAQPDVLGRTGLTPSAAVAELHGLVMNGLLRPVAGADRPL